MQEEESHSTDEQVKRDKQKDETELKEQEVPAESHLTDKQIKRDKPEQTPSLVATPPIAPTTPPQVAPTPTVVQEEPAISDKEYLIIDKESHSTENQVERDKQPALATKPEPKLTPEQKAMQLTEEELDAARKLWAKNHLSEAQKKSNESRHKRMLERMDEIEKLVKSGDSTLQELSNKINLSEKLTSSYLQKLVKAGRIKATGNTNNRRFS